jgi:uncharacterized membrane protein
MPWKWAGGGAAAVAVVVVWGAFGFVAGIVALVVAAIAAAVGVSLDCAVHAADDPMDKDRAWRIAFRLTFLVAAMVALAIVCRQGTSMFTVGLVLTVYVAAATLWIRGQHQASVDVAQGKATYVWTLPYWISGPAFGIGLAFAGFGAWQHVSTLLVAGALLAYFGVGYALMRFRLDEEQPREAVGRAALAISAVLVVVGLLLLEQGWAALAALGLGAVLAPIGPSVLAEPAIVRLQRPHMEGWVAGAAIGGAVLLAGSAGIAWLRTDHAWVLLAFVALALVVLAIVSSTQADIATVIAAVTLMGVTSMSEDKPLALTPQAGQQRVLVALGDSYMSGEGADVFFSEEVDAGRDDPENHCNRAPTAWAAMAGQTKRLFDSVAFLACSGARTFHVRHAKPVMQVPTKTQYNEPGTQLDQVDGLKKELDEDLDPSLVVVSLGGNDVGFATIGLMCLAPGDCGEERALFVDNLPAVQAALEVTYAQIRKEFPHAPVLVVPYPAPIYTGGVRKGCDQVALSAGDIAFVSSFVRELNARVIAAALSQRFYVLYGMERALADAHLQLCDPDNDGRPGINFIGLRSVAGIAEQRFNPKNWYHNSLHPNERGHAAMLQVFEQWRARHPDPRRDGPGVPHAPGTGDVPADPPCDLYDAQSKRPLCTDEATKWAEGQVSTALLQHWWGLLMVAAAVGAWLLGVALFGWWKPWWRRP